MNTLFLYSLNDRADFGDFHDVYREVTDKNCTRSIYAAFPKVDVERRKRGNHSHDSDNDNDTQTVFSPGTFLDDLKNASMNEEHFVHFTRSNIMRMKKEETKQLLLYCIMQLNENNVISTPQVRVPTIRSERLMSV